MIQTIKRATVLSSLIVLASHAYAVDYSINGFMTIAAGQMVEREKNNPAYLDYDCPCFITDYNQGGLYEGGSASFLPDSKIGLQASVFFNPDLSFTGQIVSRAVDGDLTLEWAYLSYKFASDWTLQLGRKRVPIYFYSDFQDVGNTYIMVRPQQALYGWEVSNYNGASLLYQGSLNDWNFNGSIYGGSEEVKKSGYQSLYDSVDQDVKWKNIVGTEWTLNRDWFTTRITYLQSDNYATSKPYDYSYPSTPVKQEIYGLALNADFSDWFILSEFNKNERKDKSAGMHIRAPAISVGAGYRQDQLTYFINHSTYTDKTNDYNVYEPERWSDTSLTLRYDFDATSDIKFQVDKFRENAYYDFVGDSTLVTIAYDLVF